MRCSRIGGTLGVPKTSCLACLKVCSLSCSEIPEESTRVGSKKRMISSPDENETQQYLNPSCSCSQNHISKTRNAGAPSSNGEEAFWDASKRQTSKLRMRTLSRRYRTWLSTYLAYKRWCRKIGVLILCVVNDVSTTF